MLKTFINTSLGETWEPEPEEAVEAEGLLSRRESYDGQSVMTFLLNSVRVNLFFRQT